MLRLGSKGSYHVLKQILIDQRFTQNELVQHTRLTKGRVSQIVGWLLKKGFLRKNKRSFELSSHAEVLKLIRLLRELEPAFSIRVSIESVDALLEMLHEERIILCESSSLCFYDLYCTHKGLDFYTGPEHVESAKTKLKALPAGDFEVNVYLPDLPLEDDTNYIGHQRITGEIRTVIDLYTVGKTGDAQRLMQKIWPYIGPETPPEPNRFNPERVL